MQLESSNKQAVSCSLISVLLYSSFADAHGDLIIGSLFSTSIIIHLVVVAWVLLSKKLNPYKLHVLFVVVLVCIMNWILLLDKPAYSENATFLLSLANIFPIVLVVMVKFVLKKLLITVVHRKPRTVTK